MAAQMLLRPSGRVSEVFENAAARQSAYDFLESAHVAPEAIIRASVEACAERAGDYPFVFVPLDGTSLNLVDHATSKDFGSVGSRDRGARGLKVIDAMAVTPTGVPLGIASMQWWARGPRSPIHNQQRRTDEKETQHWLDAVSDVASTLARVSPGTKPWFQIDREGDVWSLLEHLAASGAAFTVRSQSDRKLHTTGAIMRPSKRHPETNRRYLPSTSCRCASMVAVPSALAGADERHRERWNGYS
jgi:hypothetical protein